MSKICHRHCPAEASVIGAAVAVVVIAAGALAVAPVVAASMGAIVAAGFAVLAASVAAGAVVVRRLTRPVPFGPEIAQAPRALPATRVQAALPARQRAAITASRIWAPGEITDAEHRARVTRDGS